MERTISSNVRGRLHCWHYEQRHPGVKTFLAVMAGVLALGPSAAAAQSFSVRSFVGTGAGLRVFRITGPPDVRSVLIRWGDGTASHVSRACATRHRVYTPNKYYVARPDLRHGVFYAPHTYVANGAFRVSAVVVSRGCTSARRARSSRLAATIDVSGAGPTAGAAAGGPPDNSGPPAKPGPNWVSFNQPYGLANASFDQVGGTSKNGGCEMTTPEVDLSPPQAGIERDEVAADPASCTILLEQGTPPWVGGAPPAHASTVWQSQIGYQAWQTDYAGLFLTGVVDHVAWRWNGGCVTELVSGWSAFQYGVNWRSDNDNVAPGQNCFHAIVRSNAIFEDDFICGPNATFDVYENVPAAGHYDGSAAWGGTSYLDDGSACASAQSFHDAGWWDYWHVFVHNVGDHSVRVVARR